MDPNNAGYHYQLALTRRYARDYDTAYEGLQRALDLNPSSFNTYYQLASTEVMRGNDEDALRALEIAEALYERIETEDWRLAQFAFAYSQLGRQEDVFRILIDLEELNERSLVDDAVWAMMYLALNEHDDALRYLETAVNEQLPNMFTLAEIKANAFQLPVLEEPQFRELRGQIGAPN